MEDGITFQLEPHVRYHVRWLLILKDLLEV